MCTPDPDLLTVVSFVSDRPPELCRSPGVYTTRGSCRAASGWHCFWYYPVGVLLQACTISNGTSPATLQPDVISTVQAHVTPRCESGMWILLKLSKSCRVTSIR